MNAVGGEKCVDELSFLFVQKVDIQGWKQFPGLEIKHKVLDANGLCVAAARFQDVRH